ncbi:MAG TPA: GDSL family lipase [Phycisphaerales bacterium]|nr:GDSL family lipase [Phycisphaerales bacterium]HBR18810.1 GDSL family lipase [Phycisphaerales bacterium]
MKKFLSLSLLITAILYGSICQAGLYDGKAKVNPCDVKIGSHKAVTPVARPDVDWWTQRHQAVVNRVKQGNVDLIMLGDSITQGWEQSGKQVWDKYYAPRNALNIGFSGDRTQNVIWRLQNGEIENIKPKLAVIMIGINNSGDEYTAEQIADGIKTVVCQLRTKLPETKVLILAIFPLGESKISPQITKNHNASKLASKIADNKTIFYLDINKKFLNKKGVLTKEVMPDLLHPNEKGYQIWAEAVEPTIAKLMGEKK